MNVNVERAFIDKRTCIRVCHLSLFALTFPPHLSHSSSLYVCNREEIYRPSYRQGGWGAEEKDWIWRWTDITNEKWLLLFFFFWVCVRVCATCWGGCVCLRIPGKRKDRVSLKIHLALACRQRDRRALPSQTVFSNCSSLPLTCLVCHLCGTSGQCAVSRALLWPLLNVKGKTG